MLSLTPTRPLQIPFRELASGPLTRIANRKLDWVLGASLDNELSRPQLSCPGLVLDPLLMELELVMKIIWKREVDLVAGW